MAVYRIFVEKKPSFANEAAVLLADVRGILRMENVVNIRVINRYDVEGIDEATFKSCVNTVFSEPPIDIASSDFDANGAAIIATEYLPGQYDQRADSCAQCIKIVSAGDRPIVKTAKIYLVDGKLAGDDLDAIKKYIINPVEMREATLELPKTITAIYEIPTSVATIDKFIDMNSGELAGLIGEFGLAMDEDDIKCCQDYFKTENRNPTMTELKMIDTYWSDHCRHTTFSTVIDNVEFADKNAQKSYDKYLGLRKTVYGERNKPITLMDLATIGAKYLKKAGLLTDLDESEEINACSVKIDVDVDGKIEKWILMFKNETHNHPTEIEPFGGAATCIGGAIRDPLSGRSYVYQAMRVTGAADPLLPIEKTLPGKLPQRKIVQTAAAGYSSYGNQIGLATGLVDEVYHPGYVAKRMEIGAVVGAAPAKNIRRECPVDGDAVILLGGRTGRDGCGGATGSSKAHTEQSLETCGAEVQKGNAPEERKLQRLFRNERAAAMIKRCNDFGAGGVSVAIGELADGLMIDLDKVTKKYEGLDGTELAISESQERMAVVVAPEDAAEFLDLASAENLEGTVVATVTQSPRLAMTWNGTRIVDLSREFLNSNGAEKHITAQIAKGEEFAKNTAELNRKNYLETMQDLNVASKRGLGQRFDSTIGASSVLLPYGGKNQTTPTQVMAAKIPVLYSETKTCSVMAYGFNPYLMEKSPYLGAYYAVVESVCKLSAAGASYKNCHLTFQEYFEKLGSQSSRWGKPMAALLGALEAQMQLKTAAIGGKDSMSGSFDKIDVPPTLVSFAIATANSDNVISPEFKAAGNSVVVLQAAKGENGLLDEKSLTDTLELVENLVAQKQALSAYVPTYGGVGAAVAKMCFGNSIGFEYDTSAKDGIFENTDATFIVELATDAPICGTLLGKTTAAQSVKFGGESIELAELFGAYESKLEPIFPIKTKNGGAVEAFSYKAEKCVAPAIKTAKPRVLIPVFPGTNCEFDTANAFRKAGAEPEIFVLRNLTASDISQSISAMAEKIAKSQIIALPGGFSGGDEPDGSAKFITALLRNPMVAQAVEELLNSRDGLMCGICNGFQALVKLGLLPYGKICDIKPTDPTLAINEIGRHQSGVVRTRIASNKSPWLMEYGADDVHTIAISHGEGRFIASEECVREMAANGQIATQYVDENGAPSMDVAVNPNGSAYAIEGITSPDGRIFGKMGHSERCGDNIYKNIGGDKEQRMFNGAIKYFSL